MSYGGPFHPKGATKLLMRHVLRRGDREVNVPVLETEARGGQISPSRVQSPLPPPTSEILHYVSMVNSMCNLSTDC